MAFGIAKDNSNRAEYKEKSIFFLLFSGDDDKYPIFLYSIYITIQLFKLKVVKEVK